MSNPQLHDDHPSTSVPNKSSILQGGVTIGSQPDLPEGHANVGDKIVRKAQKVIGKYMNNPEMHERGELREMGGKAAAEAHARAAHD